MSKILQNLHRNQAIPLSSSRSNSSYSTKEKTVQGIRRRLSSSLSSATGGGGGGSAASSWSFPRSKSVEYAGTTVREWWNWGWGRFLSGKPIFARDLEMNEEETAAVGYQNKGSWKHVFYKVKKEILKLLGSSADNMGLPQTYKKAYSKI